ncbi:MAG: nicotinate phosphoribosyltransferase [Methanoregulaceae archaeon]|nr:nicotinate phosphoribosyltransferase [Methanoregulaceae archaeon]
MGLFGTVDEEVIKRGDCADIYFLRCEEILQKEGKNPLVVMEVTAVGIPDEWGVFCGLEDVIALLKGLPVTVDAMPEGTMFLPNEPVLRISGRYLDFARYETSILGFLCHASGIATAAAHIRVCAEGRPVYSFGSRRQHPAIASMIERAAWIGGVDGVSNTCSHPDIPKSGTMPHAFVMCYDNPAAAFASFNRNASPEVPRIMLSDTFCDEKRESLVAAGQGACAVRLDTPRSRRGDMRAIINEVRWELDAHGYSGVKIFLSGGVTRDEVIEYRDIVDAFGIGGAIANAPVIDFAMDIVEMEGTMCSKRGKRCGVKQVYELPDRFHVVLLEGVPAPAHAKPLLVRYLTNGTVVTAGDLQEARMRFLGSFETSQCSCGSPGCAEGHEHHHH